MPIDIVIVNYRTACDVAQCLDRLGPWTEGTVWLVDNSERDSQAQALTALAAARPERRLTVATRNLGFAAACNLAWAQSTAPWVLLLNPDARIEGDAVRALAQVLRSNSRLAAVSPQTAWNAQRSFVLPPLMVEDPWSTLLPLVLARAAGLARFRASALVRHERLDAAHHGLRRCAALSGAVLMLRRAAVDAAGGLFDPRFFMFYEDADLSRRLRHASWQLAIDRDTWAEHGWHHRADKAPLMDASCHAYFAKHYPRWHRATRRLARLAVTGPGAGFDARCRPLGAFSTATEFNARAGGGVLAFSPSPWLWPALFRPRTLTPPCFDDREWDLLEPSDYAALVLSAVGPRWLSFTKSAPAPAAADAPATS